MRLLRKSLALGPVALNALVEASPVTPMLGHKLAKRDVTSVNCGVFPTADAGNAWGNDQNIEIKDGCYTVAARTCNRFGCFNTSGFYVCNDQDVDICVPYADAVSLNEYAWRVCSPNGASLSSQIFTTDLGGYNVITAYANCNDSPATKPSTYGDDNGGPNGPPGLTCGTSPQSPCLYQSCSQDQITVSAQESVTCNEYMGSVYVPSGEQITYGTSRTIGSTWSVGGFLSIDSGDLAKASAQVGFFASFSETTTTGTVVSGTGTCGKELGLNGALGNWTCGMDIAPKCIQTTGTCDTGDSVLGIVPFVTQQPQTGADGQSVYTPTLCVCKNCPGWADGGAPQRPCDLDCATCETPAGGI